MECVLIAPMSFAPGYKSGLRDRWESGTAKMSLCPLIVALLIIYKMTKVSHVILH